MKKHLDLTKEQFKAFLELPTEGAISMLNLLKFKPEGGKETYKKYMAAAQPFFAKANAKIIFFGKPQFTLIGDPKEDLWDEVLIVEYTDKSDFIKMITTPGYPAEIRREAVEDSRLIFCKK